MIRSLLTQPKYRAAIFWVLALPPLYFISRHNYNLFHVFVDGASIVIAACVFLIIWNARRIIDNDYFLYVGIAFLFFAFMDSMHVLGNKNMGVFPEYGNLGPALYIASRYILGISLMIAPLFIHRKLNTTLMFAVYSLGTSFILLSVFYWQIFPVCIVEGVGLTPFKVVSDYIICLFLLGAIGLLLINRRSFDSRVLRIIVSSIILSIATGVAFTLYADPFGIMNAVGHFFQIASFYLIYLAIIETSLTKPQDVLYQKLRQSEEKLAENIQQLDYANVELKQKIAERRQAEESLQKSRDELEQHVRERTAELELRNQELQNFTFVAAHDLQEPLRKLQNFGDLITTKCAGSIGEQGRDYLRRMVQTAARMQALLLSLLDYSRLTSKAAPFARVKLKGIVEAVLSDLEVAVRETNGSVEIGDLPEIEADPGQMASLFQNLLGNALKFRRKDGTPHVRIHSNHKAGGGSQTGEWEIYVEDDGIGFEEVHQDLIFRPFQQLHGRNQYPGVGMGLAICKKVVERHGGTITARSTPGQGSTFIVKLPKKR
jgi:signal transduction histidine kinase